MLRECREKDLAMTVNTTDSNVAPQPLDDWFLSLLACPACPQRLPLHRSEDTATLVCACGRYAYPINANGVPSVIVEEAVLLNENAHPEDVV